MECNCNFQYVKKLKTNGDFMIISQCFECGNANYKQIKFDLIGGRNNIDKIKNFDEILEKLYYENKQKKYYEERQKQKEEWFKESEVYYKSDKWKLKRQFVFERDKYKCQACLTNKAEQVHHLTYRHWMNEPLFDLISVCIVCHNKITKLERNEISN
jgi:5-methylcytosine-specific restriction endonuclease McrA